ncbi:helix-turn-helix domain-containing protein [Desulfohalobium retbaense]|uniref:helix-turn-helix domain-containing protein n=1 Tax=Desulfohalobium retbaense TaxID=45663 RepID=UPI001FCA040D|nr:helix-turn-helix transcriptional regulator [Desulfohalobium retbaense]
MWTRVTLFPGVNSFPSLRTSPNTASFCRQPGNRSGLTQVEFSEKTGIAQSHLLSMENGKLEIGKDQAKRLA